MGISRRKKKGEAVNLEAVKKKALYSEDQGRELLKLARSAIASKLDIKSDLPQPSELMAGLKDELFSQKRGIFVTIHLNKKLRGCIGTLESVEKVKEGVKHNAVSAAFQDPRFPPLTSEEFNGCHLEVSILSQPVALEYSDVKDLLSKLQEGIHGVIIRKEGAKATFLPQVWQQLPDKALFLSNLCRKAGLSDLEWKRGTLDVMTYTVQYFEE